MQQIPDAATSKKQAVLTKKTYTPLTFRTVLLFVLVGLGCGVMLHEGLSVERKIQPPISVEPPSKVQFANYSKDDFSTHYSAENISNRSQPLHSQTEAERKAAFEVELARLVTTCPSAATIDFEKVYRYNVQQVAAEQQTKNNASVRYPVKVRPPAVRIAANGPWLVPKDQWYTENDLQKNNASRDRKTATQPTNSAETTETTPTIPAAAPAIEPSQPVPTLPAVAPIPTPKPTLSTQPIAAPADSPATMPAAIPAAIPTTEAPAVPSSSATTQDTSKKPSGTWLVPPKEWQRSPTATTPTATTADQLPAPSQQQQQQTIQRLAPLNADPTLPIDQRPEPDNTLPTPPPIQIEPTKKTPSQPAKPVLKIKQPEIQHRPAGPIYQPQLPAPIRRLTPQDLLAPPKKIRPAAPTHGLLSSPHGKSQAKVPADLNGKDPHQGLYDTTMYPSAKACAKCHENIYHEWSSSSHAYAAVSPMFHKFEQKLNALASGTVGYFCMRCHTQVGAALNMPRETPIWDMPQVAREGVTCIVCHRANERYGKVNGERRIVPGDLSQPIYGPIGGAGVAEAIAQKSHYKIKTSPNEKGSGQLIHNSGIFFEPLTKSEFCVSCHQVAVQPMIKLEVVWEQYRASPACKKGISCQDCHMGKIPGVPSGYASEPIAEIGGRKFKQKRRHANHNFYGPGYSIAHPGVFPFHLKADRWTPREWLLFNHRAGWGTDDFEDGVDEGTIQADFPEVWSDSDDRMDAREIIEDNLKKVKEKNNIRQQVMENGAHIDGPFFSPRVRTNETFKFHYIVTNVNEGHNLPSGSLGAQPQLWANVVLIDPDGYRIWESGYTDSQGDVADIHSTDVRNKKLPFDSQLFNLQTMFLITSAKGTDREFFIPVNINADQLPFIRPAGLPASVTNHPGFIRMEGRSISPLGSKKVKYKVPAHLMKKRGTYRLSFRMRSRLEPIYFMKFVGATDEMIRAMNEGILDVHPHSVEFFVQ